VRLEAYRQTAASQYLIYSACRDAAATADSVGGRSDKEDGQVWQGGVDPVGVCNTGTAHLYWLPLTCQ